MHWNPDQHQEKTALVKVEAQQKPSKDGAVATLSESLSVKEKVIQDKITKNRSPCSGGSFKGK